MNGNFQLLKSTKGSCLLNFYLFHKKLKKKQTITDVPIFDMENSDMNIKNNHYNQLNHVKNLISNMSTEGLPGMDYYAPRKTGRPKNGPMKKKYKRKNFVRNKDVPCFFICFFMRFLCGCAKKRKNGLRLFTQ